jgi:hypothetical protein
VSDARTDGLRRLGLSLSTIAVISALFLLNTVWLQAVSRRAEASGEVYPYRNEDWLRYLVPSLWPASASRPLILLTGPSTVRENLLVEDFAGAFPSHRVFQGALSLGTLNDVLASLKYVRAAYGAGALPSILVLGISPRFLAEIPDDRPFAEGLDRYSPRYRIDASADSAAVLVEKAPAERVVDRARFFARKQTPRYYSAAAWLMAQAVGPELSAAIADSPAGRSKLARLVFTTRAMELGLYRYGMELASPYKYRGSDPMPVDILTAWLDDSASWWVRVHGWDPARHSPAVRRRLADLRSLVGSHGIELYVVDMPERSVSSVRYAAGVLDGYRALVDSALAGVPVLHLRDSMSDSEFFDAEHIMVPGARRLSARVIDFIRETRAAQNGARAGQPDAATAAGSVDVRKRT